MDELFMGRALDLAKKGEGKVSPNPMVGAVIVKNDLVIGEGYHEEYGKSHAEANAFLNVQEDTTGATMYVTLEPCCHFGKNPPCTDLIIQHKIKKVVVGSLDPNPLVAGKGIEILRKHGIEVITGVLEEECTKLNEVFMKYITTNKPFVIMKSAMTLDGKIASNTGDSKWVTGEKSREDVHRLRNKVSGIMVGIGTVLADNPELTCRLENGVNPTRIIVDSSLRIPLDAKVVETANSIPTIVATTNKADKDKIHKLTLKGVRVLIIEENKNRVSLYKLMENLGEMKIDSILLEGGATLNYSALEEKIVDKVMVYIAPKIVGGETSKTPVGGSGIELMANSINLKDVTVRRFNEDIFIEGYV